MADGWGTSTIPFYYDAAGNRIGTFGLGGGLQFNLDTGEQYAAPQWETVPTGSSEGGPQQYATVNRAPPGLAAPPESDRFGGYTNVQTYAPNTDSLFDKFMQIAIPAGIGIMGAGALGGGLGLFGGEAAAGAGAAGSGATGLASLGPVATEGFAGAAPALGAAAGEWTLPSALSGIAGASGAGLGGSFFGRLGDALQFGGAGTDTALGSPLATLSGQGVDVSGLMGLLEPGGVATELGNLPALSGAGISGTAALGGAPLLPDALAGVGALGGSSLYDLLPQNIPQGLGGASPMTSAPTQSTLSKLADYLGVPTGVRDALGGAADFVTKDPLGRALTSGLLTLGSTSADKAAAERANQEAAARLATARQGITSSGVTPSATERRYRGAPSPEELLSYGQLGSGHPGERRFWEEVPRAAEGGGFDDIMEGVGPLGMIAGGMGGGQADDVPALLSEGEFVVPADVVSDLGDGSNERGAQMLQEMIENVRQQKGRPEGLPPPAEAPERYMRGGKTRG